MQNKITDVFNHAVGRPGFDYSSITQNIFIGSNMCCQFGFARELLAKNVRADISLEDLRVDAPHGVDYFLWLPTADEHAPTMDKLVFGIQALEFFAARNIKVFIHCKNGHGRAPTLFAAYLMKTGMTMDAAIALIAQQRPTIHITNIQIEALKNFGASIKS